jgi:lipid-A-disaccharide synthase
MPRLLLSCGEPSGELYGAELVRHLRQSRPDLDVIGLGGDRLLAQGARLQAHLRDLAVVGIVEVLSRLGDLRRAFAAILAEADRARPDAAVLVDYPDFNLRLAAELRRRGIPVIYYVSPQVWAWRPGRIRQIRERVAHMIVIFPFEEELYQQAQVPVTFVGHPLVDVVQPPGDPAGFLRSQGLDPARPVIALLPGSRRKEVAHNLPPLAGAVRQLAGERPDLQFLLAEAPHLPDALLTGALAGLPVTRVPDRAHDVVGSATAAIVASGTATVETALLGTPMVVVYRISPLTYALGRRFVKVSQFAMVNLIAGRTVVPELMQGDYRPERVAAEVRRLLETDAGAVMRTGLEDVRARLGGGGASQRAAEVVARIAWPRDAGIG